MSEVERLAGLMPASEELTRRDAACVWNVVLEDAEVSNIFQSGGKLVPNLTAFR